MIADLRSAFNSRYRSENYSELLANLDARSGTKVEFRVAETPVFLPQSMLDQMAQAGIELTRRLLAWPEYLQGARRSIPDGFLVAGETQHPHFLTADFALIRTQAGELVPRLVEIQAFPSVYAYQAMLSEEYRRTFQLPENLGVFLGRQTEQSFWELMRRSIVGRHTPENVVLTEVDPQHQKTLPDFLLTSKELGIAVVDIATLIPVGNRLHYRDQAGRLVPIHRIYNRAIADEMIARKVELPFSLTDPWEVEWAGHPNWYFLISKYAVPWLWTPAGKTDNADLAGSVVPPAVFLEDFLDGRGFDRLAAAGVPLPVSKNPETVYDNLLLKPLFSFAG